MRNEVKATAKLEAQQVLGARPRRKSHSADGPTQGLRTDIDGGHGGWGGRGERVSGGCAVPEPRVLRRKRRQHTRIDCIDVFETIRSRFLCH